MIQLIIGVWTLLMIFVLCFEDCRAYLKNMVESLIYDLNSLYKDAKDEKGICLACLLMLFITLILLFCCLLFFPLLPLFSVCFVFGKFRNKNGTDDTWLREQQEREENYRRKRNKFKGFHYPGKVSFDFDADTYIYVENRYVRRGISHKRLRMELQQKGISSDLISAAMTKVQRDESEEIFKVIAKKRKKYNDFQLVGYLVRQGFNFQQAKDAVETVKSQDDAE